MSTFREIDERLLALVDEDGEILDIDAFSALQMERAAKAESMALWTLDLKDEQEAIRNEIKRLQARLASAERKERSLKEFLSVVLDGQKMKTARVSISYRSATSVEISDESAVREWADSSPVGDSILKYKEPDISKTAMRELMTSGIEIPGASVVTKTSTVIK